jgi:hypothetical protein
MMTEEEKHQLIRAKGLEEKNYSQAQRLMEYELKYKGVNLQDFKAYTMLKKEYQRVVNLLKDEIEKNKGLEAEILPFEKPKAKLDILIGGKDGDGSDNWLSDLDEGCVFVSRMRKESNPLAEQWHVSIKWRKSTVLYSNFPHRGDVYILVVNQMFAEQNELIEILKTGKEENDE